MKRLIALALSVLLLCNPALADQLQSNAELQQQTQDRNEVIGISLQRKLDAMLDDRMREDDRFDAYGLVVRSRLISDNLLAAAR